MIANGPARGAQSSSVSQWTPAQVALFEQYQEEHQKDPTVWSESVRAEFAAELARLASGGAA